VLDIAMPGMSGVAFLHHIRNTMSPRIPLVVHSAVADPDEMIKDDHVDAVVPKGYDPSVLLSTIRQLLGMSFYPEPDAA
jgi:CheY-like chemotaxis protein